MLPGAHIVLPPYLLCMLVLLASKQMVRFWGETNRLCVMVCFYVDLSIKLIHDFILYIFSVLLLTPSSFSSNIIMDFKILLLATSKFRISNKIYSTIDEPSCQISSKSNEMEVLWNRRNLKVESERIVVELSTSGGQKI